MGVCGVGGGRRLEYLDCRLARGVGLFYFWLSLRVFPRIRWIYEENGLLLCGVIIIVYWIEGWQILPRHMKRLRPSWTE